MQAPSVTMTTLGPSRVQLSLCDREETENSEIIVEMTLKLPPPHLLSPLPLGWPRALTPQAAACQALTMCHTLF